MRNSHSQEHRFCEIVAICEGLAFVQIVLDLDVPGRRMSFDGSGVTVLVSVTSGMGVRWN